MEPNIFLKIFECGDWMVSDTIDRVMQKLNGKRDLGIGENFGFSLGLAIHA